jgi:hypothetical protein
MSPFEVNSGNGPALRRRRCAGRCRDLATRRRRSRGLRGRCCGKGPFAGCRSIWRPRSARCYQDVLDRRSSSNPRLPACNCRRVRSIRVSPCRVRRIIVKPAARSNRRLYIFIKGLACSNVKSRLQFFPPSFPIKLEPSFARGYRRIISTRLMPRVCGSIARSRRHSTSSSAADLRGISPSRFSGFGSAAGCRGAPFSLQ